jgi:hypothetical protein
MPPRPFLFCLAIPPIALAAQLGAWELASTAAAAMAIDSALRWHHRRMLGWAGLAIGTGLSGVLLLPLVAALLIARRIPARDWPILPVVAAAVAFPDFPLPVLRDGVPNLWSLLPLETLPMLGLACAASIGATAAYIAQFSVLTRHATTPQLLRSALLAALGLPLLLPAMSSGAFFLAGLLALSLAWRTPGRDSAETAALVQGGLALGMAAQATGLPTLAALGGALLGAATLRVARPLLHRAANDNPAAGRTLRYPSIPA